jgi:4'-phosphopantetheinyl transferase
VGIDVEELAPIEFKIANDFFSLKEFAYIKQKPVVERNRAFYDIWTLKESYVKALGYGLSKALNSFTVELYDNGKAKVKETYGYSPVFLCQYDIHQDYRLSVCAFHEDFQELNMIDIEWIQDSLNR